MAFARACLLVALLISAVSAQVPSLEGTVCTADLSNTQMDPTIHCNGAYFYHNCPTICPGGIPYARKYCGCQPTPAFLMNMFVKGHDGVNNIVYVRTCLNWQDAQERCCWMGGRLWEPATSADYLTGVNSLISNAPSLQAQTECAAWIGFNNYNPPDGSMARHATFNAPAGTNAVNDGVDGGTENCVFFVPGSPNAWYDSNCSCLYTNFICQI